MGKASSQLIPLFITLVLVVIAACVGYVVYAIATSVSDTTSQKMQKHNIAVSRDGMKVHVKDVDHEHYTDSTQSVLMKVWDNASWPAYKSKLGWGQPKGGKKDEKKAGTSSARSTSTGTQQRKPVAQ